MSVNVKICGLKDAASLHAAIASGAHYVGFVFYPPSPRAIAPSDAYELIKLVPPSVIPVGLFVDPTDDDLKDALAQTTLGIIQLHGKEAPERVTAIKDLTNIPVMKALPIATKDDLAVVKFYEPIVDWLLFDAKPAPDAALPGGNAEMFDWGILDGFVTHRPWMLAGGLNAANLTEAVHVTKARNVDVSSGVESVPGKKDPEKIKTFLSLAARLSP